jgi:hypothetical protein
MEEMVKMEEIVVGINGGWNSWEIVGDHGT